MEEMAEEELELLRRSMRRSWRYGRGLRRSWSYGGEN
jgi:hypothetical protein